jgi:predicted nucleic-acid-binding protein
VLTADDSTQSDQARQLLRRAEHRGERLYVPLTVTLELEWVLRSFYRYGKDQVLAALSSLLATRELEFQNEPVVEDALGTYQQNRVDFAECLHLACAASANQWPLFTFDRSAARIQGMQFIGSPA